MGHTYFRDKYVSGAREELDSVYFCDEIKTFVTLRFKLCMVATAAFGSELAPEVQFLRNFRETVIKRTFVGITF